MGSVSNTVRSTLPWLSHVNSTTRFLGPTHYLSLGFRLPTTPLLRWSNHRVRPIYAMKSYFEEAVGLMKSDDSGGPRWLMPLECGGSRVKDSPLLLYLPGIDGVGLGLMKQHVELGKIYEVWCLHIPITDRTSFSELVKLVGDIIRSESIKSPTRPIYVVGEGFGGCFALSVAANNPDVDLLLLLANPTTCFSKLSVRMFKPFIDWMRSQTSLEGVDVNALQNIMKNVTGVHPKICEDIFADFDHYFANLLSADTAAWKLEMLLDASTYTNSILHKVEAKTLIMSSGKHVLPGVPSNKEEVERLRRALPNCHTRTCNYFGHCLFLENGFSLVYIIKRTGFYRRQKKHDWIKDYSIVKHEDIVRASSTFFVRSVEKLIHPATYSTLESGEIVKGLEGYPTEGPTILVGYHMLTGLEAILVVKYIYNQRNVVVRGLAHPNLFLKSRFGGYLDLTAFFDGYRVLGAVPVSARNMFTLLTNNDHILLYPGGMREAFHRKGEEYKLFWPEDSEFVRMAAATGARIVPFGVVGEDDIYQLCADYNDFSKVPILKHLIDVETHTGVILRSDKDGEVSNQPIHFPLILPKIPGRLYVLIGKPIETKGRKEELGDKQKAHELYLHIKAEIEASIAYLKEKRKQDPYRNIFPRLLYQTIHGFNKPVPSFDP